MGEAEIVRDESIEPASTLRLNRPWAEMSMAAETVSEDADPNATIGMAPPSLQLDTGSLPTYLLQTETIPPNKRGQSRLTLLGVLGRGGMGVINAARQVSLGREVAVKRPHRDTTRESTRDQLLREAMITGALEHPNIVPVYDLGRDEQGEPLLLMKRVEGQTWSELLRTRPMEDFEEKSRWLESQLDIFSSVCDAMRFAHAQNIIHRDLKPENVMVGSYGEVYLLDWGVAVSVDESAASRFPLARDSRQIAGTPAYMSPEQATADATSLGLCTDIYLLGAMLYELLTSRAPHASERAMTSLYSAYTSAPPVFAPEVPPSLAQICRVAMARDPADRYPDVATLQASLRAWRTHLASVQLSRAAHELLRRYRDELAAQQQGEITEVDPRDQLRLITECRFGFMQALKVWPENDAAQDGLQSIGVLAVRSALSERDEKLAAMWLADLPRPEPELEALLSELQQDLEAQRLEQARLEDVGRSFDVSAGWVSRRRLAAALGVIWSSKPLIHGTLEHLGITTPTYGTQHAGGLLFLLVLLLAGWLGRKTWSATALNRALFILLLGVALIAGLGRAIAQLAEMNLVQSIIMDTLIYSLGVIGAAAVTTDRWLLPLSVPYLLSAALAALFPKLVFFILAGAHSLTFALLLFMWRPTRAGQLAKG